MRIVPIILLAGLVVLLVVYRICLWKRVRPLVTLGILACTILLVGVTLTVMRPARVSSPVSVPPGPEAAQVLPSQVCAECHASQHDSWHRSYHRTMTRDATPENMKADFNDATFTYHGITSRMTRRGEEYIMQTVDPEWELAVLSRGVPLDQAGPGPLREFTVDRIVGSHWFQQFMSRDEEGRYIRLPLAYHIVEKRWIHINGAFVNFDNHAFFGKTNTWNATCIYCHNTLPAKNPVPIPNQPQGYRSEVAELGIACAACHGSGERHVRTQQAVARGEAVDPTESDIVNPSRLSVARADDICARCHGGTMPRWPKWDRRYDADPFRPGQDLRESWYVSFTEAELRLRREGNDDLSAPMPSCPEQHDGRFWGDGTPLATATEYQGMALSACYQKGNGKLSCRTCHTMHGSDPNHQLKPEMRTNAACYKCHESYRGRLAEHTHHSADSSGSLCYNCHMPHQVYSLLDTHRSHRIMNPRVKDSLGTGKPHACNLCHLDKSLGWTQDHLVKWYGAKPEPLSEDDQTIASSVLHLTQGDARTRAVVAGAFGRAEAQQVSGRDWPVMVLTRALADERYEAVRYTQHKSLRLLCGPTAEKYDYQGTAATRTAQLQQFRRTLEVPLRIDPLRYKYIPLAQNGAFSDDVFNRLRRGRLDPDVIINE